MSDYNNLDPDFLNESSRINIEDYICCICQYIPNPETAIEEENCGHLFCKICLNQWLDKSKECPFCKEIIIQRIVKNKNKLVYRYLINLVVICQENNCKWKGILKEYNEHMINNHKKKNEQNNFEFHKYYKATVHEHPLLFLDLERDNGWACNGRNFPTKCFSGITDFDQTNKIKRFRCHLCDFDLCELCMKYYYDKNYKYSENNQNQTYEKQIKKGIYLLNKRYYTSVHKHPLVFLDKSLNTGWACNGRDLKEKCLSGITGFNQTDLIPRFRCVKCDFDLCENCMNHYKRKTNYELNKLYTVDIHLHPLKYLDKTKDNGWACDGRNLKEKCLSGIVGFNESKDLERFRCEKCDFDLCRNCMDYYTDKNN